MIFTDDLYIRLLSGVQQPVCYCTLRAREPDSICHLRVSLLCFEEAALPFLRMANAFDSFGKGIAGVVDPIVSVDRMVLNLYITV